MLLIRRVLITLFSILGSLLAIILLAAGNALFNLDLSAGQVVLFGLLGGLIIGIAGTFIFIRYAINKLKSLVAHKLGFFKRFSFFGTKPFMQPRRY